MIIKKIPSDLENGSLGVLFKQLVRVTLSIEGEGFDFPETRKFGTLNSGVLMVQIKAISQALRAAGKTDVARLLEGIMPNAEISFRSGEYEIVR